MPSKKVTWNYPVRPGTEEWKQLNSFKERLDAFNIPDDVLLEITTEELVKTCLEYPWWILITSRDYNQEGYDFLKSVFNGFRELEKREDAGRELIKEYEKMNPEDIYKFDTLVKQGVFSFKFTYIELLLAQKDIVKSINDKDLGLLIKKSSSVYNAKSEAFEKYSFYGIASSCLILSRVLEVKRHDNFIILGSELPEVVSYNKKGNSVNKELLDHICNEALTLLKN
ncbi:hypothetical protein [uncultured Draconibacterium sp.]|uniref:hypothetical protein n=1 Tax=uncultured Draconibacterium sp. TaxID=1573823 RepID=UPI0025F2C2DC|nr:hypothetical protein [uncultured Draconibacterium sp.]